MSRRFSNGLQFSGSYTWSHNIDDSTAEVFSTYATPRRPEDARNLTLDRASSALDRRQRFTFQVLYDVPFFKHSNWFLKNVVGNWELAPIYTYQSGVLYTVQSGIDSNLNGDAAGDRTMANPNGGNPNIGSAVTAVCKGPTAPACPATGASAVTVGYLVNNPAAGYAQAGRGVFPNVGRNTNALPPINDIDATAAKRFNFTERTSLEFSARVFNILNHPQYVGGFINDIAPIGATSSAQHSVFLPQNTLFARPSQAFSSNPRGMVLALKLVF